jgi:glycerophosphoryl diester phosphodiesterase
LSCDRRTYLDLMSDAGLKEIADYADAIGPFKWMVAQFTRSGASDTGLARRARAAGLGIHVWTLRAENQFLPDTLRSAGDVGMQGNLKGEIHALLDAGITGFFSDHPDLAVRARDEWWSRNKR